MQKVIIYMYMHKIIYMCVKYIYTYMCETSRHCHNKEGAVPRNTPDYSPIATGQMATTISTIPQQHTWLHTTAVGPMATTISRECPSYTPSYSPTATGSTATAISRECPSNTPGYPQPLVQRLQQSAENAPATHLVTHSHWFNGYSNQQRMPQQHTWLHTTAVGPTATTISRECPSNTPGYSQPLVQRLQKSAENAPATHLVTHSHWFNGYRNQQRMPQQHTWLLTAAGPTVTTITREWPSNATGYSQPLDQRLQQSAENAPATHLVTHSRWTNGYSNHQRMAQQYTWLLTAAGPSATTITREWPSNTPGY